MADEPPPARLPVTLIGGYLGAGKTTLVNHLLRAASGLRLAVLVNEFGELAIDADLIEARDEKVIAIAGGCICCSYGSDLMAALMELEALAPALDHVLIETSGVALPAAVAQSVSLLAGYALDRTVILADAETIRERGRDRYLGDTIERQLGDGDIVLLNKSDLAAPDDLVRTRQWLAARAPQAQVIETRQARVALEAILGSGLGRLTEGARSAHRHGHDHEHGPAIHDAVAFQIDYAVDAEALARRLSEAELNLVRAKGVVRAPDGGLLVVQTVARRWRVNEAPSAVEAPGRLVCIALGTEIDVDAVQRAIRAASRASD